MYLLLLACTYVSLQPKYTIYINISYSKELTKENTQLMPSSSLLPCLCGGDQLQVWVLVLSGEICNLIYTRMHREVQAFIPILAYSYGISSSPLSAYQVVFRCLEYIYLLIKEFRSCLVHDACIVSLYSSCQSWYSDCRT